MLTTCIFDSLLDEKITKSMINEQSELPRATITPPPPILDYDTTFNYQEIDKSFPFSKIRDLFLIPLDDYCIKYNAAKSEVPFLTNTNFFQDRCNILFERKLILEHIFCELKNGLRKYITQSLLAQLQISQQVIQSLYQTINSIKHDIHIYFSSNILSLNELIVYKVVQQVITLYLRQLKIFLYECEAMKTIGTPTYPIDVVLSETLVSTPIHKGKSIQFKLFILGGSLMYLPNMNISTPTPIVLVGNQSVDVAQSIEIQMTNLQVYPLCGGNIMFSEINTTFIRGSGKDVLQLRFFVNISIPKVDGTNINAMFLSDATTNIIVITNMSQWFVAQRRLFGDCLFCNYSLYSVPIDKFINTLNLICLTSAETNNKQRLPYLDYTKAEYIMNYYLPSIGCQTCTYVDAERYAFLSGVFMKYYDLLWHNRALYILHSNGCLFSFVNRSDLTHLLTLSQSKLPNNCICTILLYDLKFKDLLGVCYLEKRYPFTTALSSISTRTERNVVLLQSNQPTPPFSESSQLSFVDLDDLLSENE
ncbi:Uncharacterized protein QTN25_000572 [Entamoeba marina]